MTEPLHDPLPPLSELLAAVRAGDERAMTAFVNHYEPHLRRVLRVTTVIRLLQSQIDSQDLVQSVFTQVIADIRAERVQFNDREALEAYLRKVGRSRLHDAIRRVRAAKRGQRQTVQGDAAELAQLAQAGPSPSRMAEVREEVARVEARATPSELETIRERAEGAGWQELAAKRGLNPEALRKRIERVRRRIREALERESDAHRKSGGESS